ncbi:hypothetical protein [Burkholderia gladioli]|nr:hypothetical protein [Burkholderia gladioli]MCM2549615.1 hypothetical protein [Burkholderia glumae]MDA0573242.1 hypothetical protein [Burkholderia gladioli]MDA0601416.1 hypothetical protein [Burkholderia gladioli]
MLEELGREWPEFAFWIMTGIDDWEAGHVAPLTASHLPSECRSHSTAFSAYFKSRVQLENKRPTTIPPRVMEALREDGFRHKAAELLGGYAAIEQTRRELEDRGVIDKADKKPALRISDLLTQKRDPVVERAVAAIQHELERQEAAELASLKAARDAELDKRRGGKTSEKADK